MYVKASCTVILLLVFKFLFGQAQDLSSDQRSFYEKLIRAFRENSINKEKIDWSDFEKRVLEKALVSKDSAIILALDLNNNAHTFFKTKGKILYSSKRRAKEDCSRPVDNCFEINFKNEMHDIGYIEVPAFQAALINSSDGKKKAEKYIRQISDSIKENDKRKLKGWIIDLRKTREETCGRCLLP